RRAGSPRRKRRDASRPIRGRKPGNPGSRERAAPKGVETNRMSNSQGTQQSETGQTESFAELFEQSARTIKEGEVVQGTVLGVDNEHVHVDVGFKSEGLIPLWELMSDDGQVLVKPGDKVDVLIEE